MTDERTREWCGAIHALMFFRYNVDSQAVIETVWNAEELDPNYLAEKKKAWETCPLSFFARLDPARRRAFVETMRSLYEDEIVSRYELKGAEW